MHETDRTDAADRGSELSVGLGRWYCVAQTGEAELMENEMEAIAAAEFANKLPGRSGYRAVRLVAVQDIEQIVRNSDRYMWHRDRNPSSLLQTAWGASASACDIGADCDAATDAAMRERPNVALSGPSRE